MNSVQTMQESTQDTYGKKIIILGGVAIFLIAFFIIGSIVQVSNRRSVEIGDISEYLSEDSNIAGIIISTDQEIQLRSNASEWTVEYPNSVRRRARTSRVEELIDTMLAINFVRRVSRNSEELSEFGLGENLQTISLFDSQDRIITELHFGNLATTRNEQYFQVEDTPEVYAIDTGVNFYLEQSELFWTDFRVWNDFESEVISFYRITEDGIRELWNQDANGVWRSAEGEDASSAIDNAVRIFQALEGDSFVDSIPEDASLSLEVGVTTADAVEHSITLYSLVIDTESEDSNAEIQYFLVPSSPRAMLSLNGQTQFFTIPEWRYTGFTNF